MNTRIYALLFWSIQTDHGDDPYKAPEQSAIRLHGVCPERAAEVHREGGSGEPTVSTTRVVAFDPATLVATTRSGSRYRLEGPPSDSYATWCREQGIGDPIAVLRKGLAP